MKGLSVKAHESVERLIKSKFDSLSLSFLGLIPKTNKEKNIVFSTSRQNIISLFLQALGTRNPNKVEEQVLKKLISVASNYMDSLRDRTTATILNELDGYVTSAQSKDKSVSIGEMSKIINKQMDKAKEYLRLVANAESNKAVNTGTALQIYKMAESKQEEDPTVFFVVTIDERNDPETYRLHLLPDRLTPRVYKLSELGHEYHKKGDPWPKIQGTNPNCRCRLSYISRGFSFKNGNVAYKSPDWDEYKYQRETYGLPPSPDEIKKPKKKNK